MARVDERGVTILELSEDSLARVDETRQAAAEGEPQYLSGHLVLLDNKTPALSPEYQRLHPEQTSVARDITRVFVGGSTLDEALKEIIYTYDTHHSGAYGDPAEFDPPEFVASSHEELAEKLAEHYTTDSHTCAAVDISEVSV